MFLHSRSEECEMPSKKPRTSDRQSEIPDDGLALMRMSTILRIFPVTRSEWWARVREGRYPKPVRLGKRISAWRAWEIRELLRRVAVACALLLACLWAIGCALLTAV